MDTKLTYLHLYLLCLAACLVSACTSDPSDDLDAAKGDELTLSVGELSRSSITTDINTPNSRFAIYGNMKFKDYDPTLIFDKTIVTYNDNRWSYGATQYWFPQHVYSFVAMYPVDPTGISGTEYSDNRLSFNYTVPDNYKSASDLLVATHRRRYEENSSTPTTPVTLNF